MTRRPSPVQERVEACPGALSMHEAQDGLLARVRIPGGLITGAALSSLSRLAAAHGQPDLELTSRGNLQLRGIDPAHERDVAEGVAALGLLPSPTHELVRNIVASPLAGLDGRYNGLNELVDALDRRIRATPALSALSARFLFGLDSGDGAVAGQKPDTWAIRVGPDSWWVAPTAVEVRTAAVVPELVAVAVAFAGAAGDVRRVADLPDRGTLLSRCRAGRAASATPRVPDFGRPVGRIRHPDGSVAAVVAQVPLGRLAPAAAAALAAAAPDLRVTPWRSVVVPGASSETVACLEATGLVVGPSVWSQISACTGRPGCAKGLADVQRDARRAGARGRTTPEGRTPLPAHWSGCHRRCGRPAGPHVDVLATDSGYVVSGS